MVSEKCDIEAFTAANRRMRAEARVNYVTMTQEMAKVANLTVYENVDTGEITYGRLAEDGTVIFEGAAKNLTQMQTAAPPAVDAEVAYRRARLGLVAVIVLVFLWLWIRERRSR